MLHIEDKVLQLADGRILAYADNGNTSSSYVVLFLHGAFSVGDASHLPHTLVKNNIHFVAPTIPGWGRSSPIPDPRHYASTFAEDITTLLTHLHSDVSTLRLYICGHSFGTVQAQMLYGASPTSFPLSKQVVALVLLAPVSPPHLHKEYARSLSWPFWFMLGPPAHFTPFNILMRLSKFAISRQVFDEHSAEKFISSKMKAEMDEEEFRSLARYTEQHGITPTQFEQERGKIMWRSITTTWQAFLDSPSIFLYGWGDFNPQNANDDCRVLIVSSDRDFQVSADHARWLTASYKSASLKVIHGAHISAFFHLEQIWDDVFESVPPH
jgi:pimeloyl-ACP methyl ester carboxylesterase